MTSKLFIALASTVVLLCATLISINHNNELEKTSNRKVWEFEVIPIVDAVGPESVAFDPLGGGPYVGISDGRIIKWQENEKRWISFAMTSTNRYKVYFV